MTAGTCRRIDHAVRAGRAGNAAEDRISGLPELRMVKQIVGLRSELDAEDLRDFRYPGVLSQSHIHLRGSRPYERVPADVAEQLPPGEELQIVLLWGPSDDESVWRSAGRQQFEAAYAPEDSVYDDLGR